MREELDINTLTKEDFESPELVKTVYENFEDEKVRSLVLQNLSEFAKEKKALRVFKNNIKNYEKKNYIENVLTGDEKVLSLLERTEKGEVALTIENFVIALNNDSDFQKAFYYNEQKESIEKIENGKVKCWTDTDDSMLMRDLELKYGLFDKFKYYRAFDVAMLDRKVNPLKKCIEKEKWDGVSRIDDFVKDILLAEGDDDYLVQVSRMIFYGGISRLYNPGCKFDYMAILIGQQGAYKSSIVKWLALDDEYFSELVTIEGNEAIETLQGSWFCEMAELLAMVRTKEVEAMKGFITKTEDKYRPPYGRRTVIYPRKCIFMGTTNDDNFLYDKTGNRRYLPIKVGLRQGCLGNNLDKIKLYILNCWREALYLYENKQTYLTIPLKHLEVVQEAQGSVMESDPREELILEYLDKKNVGDFVSCLEVYINALNGTKNNLKRTQSNEISKILNQQKNWIKLEKTIRYDGKVTRVWEKIDPVTIVEKPINVKFK